MARCQEILQQLGRIEPDDDSPDLEALPIDNGLVQANWQDERRVTFPHRDSKAMDLLSATLKHSWREVFWSEDERCPAWYAKFQRGDHRRYWSDH